MNPRGAALNHPIAAGAELEKAVEYATQIPDGLDPRIRRYHSSGSEHDALTAELSIGLAPDAVSAWENEIQLDACPSDTQAGSWSSWPKTLDGSWPVLGATITI